MRLHRLTVSAFGPFAGTEHVDFDELNDAGLFLMTGDTGAGKTSLLDAVCFALYGTVPGVREVRSLRSQHADAEAVPEVVLDFTVRERRFVVRRRPEWQRAKRRGTGTTTEKASATLTELTGGSEHFLTARAAEVGHLVRDLMGMSAGQFTQVALLPQGEFQTFLRASSQERHDVLQQLFRTDRFARIEDWVGEHSRRLREEAQTGHDTVQRLLDGIAERSGTPVPADVEGDQLPHAAADGRVRRWTDEVVAAAGAAVDVAVAARASTAQASAAARAELERETRRAELRARRDDALELIAGLEATAADADRVRRRLDAHERSLRCLPVLDELDRAERDTGAAAGVLGAALDVLAAAPVPAWDGIPGLELDAVLARLPTPAPPAVTAAATTTGTTATPATPATGTTGTAFTRVDVPVDDLSAFVEAARDQAARWAALVPRELTAEDARRSRARDALARESAERELAAAETRGRRLPLELAALEQELEPVAERASRRDVLRAALDEATSHHRAAAAVPAARDRLRRLQDAERDARDRSQDARDRLQDVVARRLAGMAAELAGALTDGAACQVCGSTRHPAKARAAHDAVTDADHEAADASLTAAAEELDRTRAAVQREQQAHDALVLASAGLDATSAAAALASARSALDDATTAARRRDELLAELRDRRREQVAVADRRSAAASEVGRLTELVAAHDRTIAEVTAEITAALGGPGPVVTAATTLATWGELLADVRDAVADLARAHARVQEVATRCDRSVAGHGFTGALDVRDAVVTDHEREQLTRWLHEREAAQVRALAVLEDPELQRLTEAPAPAEAPGLARAPGLAQVPELARVEGPAGSPGATEQRDLLDRLALRAADAEEQAGLAAGSAALELDRAAALVALRNRLLEAVETWAPVRDTSLRADGIARLVKGRGYDNHLQMRLSAYVLATRLDQVVAAANERLAHMRDQRYVLQRTDRAERRGTQAGLGLEVVDQWTGEARAPTTLSGGETFVVSLALALGLADVVTHEAGGTEVETLFVDEGFGTLDADTLDDVMDRLDGLRAGGRTVGVVSHVTELRDRIPVQVQVSKGRRGSTVLVRSLAAT